MKPFSRQQAELFDAIQLEKLLAIESILTANPELIHNYGQRSLCFNVTLALHSLPALKILVAHGVILNKYHDAYNYGLITSDLGINKNLMKIEVFNYVLEQITHELDIHKRNTTLRNIFANLIQFGNYPRCRPHVQAILQSGLTNISSLDNSFAPDFLAYNQCFPHIYFILEDIIQDFRHLYPEQIAELTSFTAKNMPKNFKVEQVNYHTIINYLSSTGLTEADSVLNRFVPVISNLTTLAQLYTNKQLTPDISIEMLKLAQLQQQATTAITIEPNILAQLNGSKELNYAKIASSNLAKILHTLMRNNKAWECGSIASQIRADSTIDKTSFIIELAKQTLDTDEKMEILHLISNTFAAIDQKDLLSIAQRTKLPSLLDIFITFDLQIENNTLITAILTLAINDKLYIVAELMLPTITQSAAYDAAAIKNAYVKRQAIAQQIILSITAAQLQNYVANQTNHTVGSNASTAILLSKSVASMLMFNDNYQTSFSNQAFITHIIKPLIKMANHRHVLATSHEHIAILAQYYCNLIQLGFKMQALKILYFVTSRPRAIQVEFAASLTAYIYKNFTASCLVDPKLQAMFAVKQIILKQKIFSENAIEITLINQYSTIADKIMEFLQYRLTAEYHQAGAEPIDLLFSKNLQQIKHLVLQILFTAERLYAQIHAEIHKNTVDMCNIAIKAILIRGQSRIDGILANPLDLNVILNVMQELTEQYHEQLRKPLEKILASEITDQVNHTIDILINIIKRLATHIHLNIEQVEPANKKTVLEKALALTSLIPCLTTYTKQVKDLRETLETSITQCNDGTQLSVAPVLLNRRTRTRATVFSNQSITGEIIESKRALVAQHQTAQLIAKKCKPS